MASESVQAPVESRDAPRCRVCGEVLVAEVVWCDDCKTPHHRDCFAYAGRCAVFGCSGMRYRTDVRASTGSRWIEARNPQGSVVPRGYVVEYASRRETAASAIGGISSALALVLFMLGSVGPASKVVALPAVLLLVLGVLAFLARSQMSDYRIVDSASRRIWRHRRFLGWKRVDPEIHFDRCEGVVLRGLPGAVDTGDYAWVLEVRVGLRDPLRLTDPTRTRTSAPPTDLVEAAHRVGEILGRQVEERIEA